MLLSFMKRLKTQRKQTLTLILHCVSFNSFSFVLHFLSKQFICSLSSVL